MRASLMVLIVAAAGLLRLWQLENRPMHADEGVQAVKFGRLLEEGRYEYDPYEYHGPTLNFFTLPVAWAVSAHALPDLAERHLRLVPALFGTVTVALVWLLRDWLGRPAALWAGLLAALSPAMVFYSRYYIQETLLVCFTFGAMVALWRWLEPICLGVASPVGGGGRPAGRPTQLSGRVRRLLCPAALGLCLGLMHATKETCLIAMVAMAVAGAVALSGRLGRPALWPLLQSCLVVAAVAVSVSALLFSSFLTNPRGVIDSFSAWSHYLGRAGGHGSTGPHGHPWYWYFELLFWRPGAKGPVWSEWPVGVLALAGCLEKVSGTFSAGARQAQVQKRFLTPFRRFLVVYTLLMAAVYSVLPYKTPWCALGFLHGLTLLGGVGAAALLQAARTRPRCIVTWLALSVAVAWLGWQSWRACFIAPADPDNPYVYAHTTADVPRLAQRLRQLAAASPDGPAAHVQVICPDHDYWPLPWYLRGLSRVGWFSRIPPGPAAPLIVASPQLEPALMKHLYVDPPPGHRPLYVPVGPDDRRQDWLLRPHVPLRLYVRLSLLQQAQ